MDSESSPIEQVEIVVADDEVGFRLDALLASRFTKFSRVHLRRAINAVGVTVDGKRTKASYRVRANQVILMTLPDLPREGPAPEDIPLDILYEDDQIAVINKPPQMVVHPSKGHWQGTLASGLQFHFDQLSGRGGPARPGIVHRLDRDTSGVIIVAKTDTAHYHLATQFEQRTTEKEYVAIVVGQPELDRDLIRQPIGPHPYQREKKAIRAEHPDSREAETLYEVLERFDGFALIKAIPKTGRTHQIRVHLGYLGCPVLCDRLYGGRARISLGEIHNRVQDDQYCLTRQALHARQLTITHPDGERMTFCAELPTDIQSTLDALRLYRGLS